MSELENKYSMSVEENIFVAKRNIVDYVWKSANLEGIAVTYPQTEILFEGLSVDGLRISDINSIVNLKHAWQFVLENIDYLLDFKYLSQINKLVGDYGLVPLAGELRTADVKMGGTTWKPEMPMKEDIERNIHEISKIENTTDKALTMTLYLMRTQIFFDGNKRTAMMAGNQIMIQNGVGIISIPIEHQIKFREMLINFYETNSMQDIKAFLYKNCIDGIHFKKQINDSHKKLNEDEKIHFDVPKANVDMAKEIGAKWDTDQKSWYIMSDNPKKDELLEIIKVGKEEQKKKEQESNHADGGVKEGNVSSTESKIQPTSVKKPRVGV